MPACLNVKSREMSTSERDVSVERLGRMRTSLKSSLSSCSMCMCISARQSRLVAAAQSRSPDAKNAGVALRQPGVDELYSRERDTVDGKCRCAHGGRRRVLHRPGSGEQRLAGVQ